MQMSARADRLSLIERSWRVVVVPRAAMLQVGTVAMVGPVVQIQGPPVALPRVAGDHRPPNRVPGGRRLLAVPAVPAAATVSVLVLLALRVRLVLAVTVVATSVAVVAAATSAAAVAEAPSATLAPHTLVQAVEAGRTMSAVPG